MIWLVLDASGNASTVAVATETQVIAELTVRRRRTHSEQLVRHIDTVLQLAGTTMDAIEGVAVTTGPGSFTGLRIGLATAKALAFARGWKLVGVDTLRALLYNYANAAVPLAVLLDAQKRNVYLLEGTWQGETLVAGEPQVVAIDTWCAAQRAAGATPLCVGEGAELYAEEIRAAGGLVAPVAQRSVRAAAVAQYAAAEWARRGEDDIIGLLPNYIRRSEAEVLWEARQCKK